MRENQYNIQRRDFLRLLLIGFGATVIPPACTNLPTSETTPHPKSTSTVVNTQAAIIHQKTSTPPPPAKSEIEITTLTPEQRFKIGQFNAAKEGFTAHFSDDLNAFLGYIKASNKILTADIPLPILGPEFGTDEQYEVFEKARYFTFDGNPYFVIRTDRPNHLFFYFHSITSSSVGEIPRKITSFQILNPEKSSEILGQKLILNLGKDEYIGEIVDTRIVDHKFFENLNEGSPWGVYPDQDNVLFGQTDEFGIPESIRSDETPNVFYITLISCQSKNGRVSAFNIDNIQSRALVTVKIQLP